MAQSLWTDNGTYWASPRLSKQMRDQALPNFVYRQFTDLKNALGANAGDRVLFPKKLRVDTRGGTLIETNTVSVNEIKFRQGTVQVTEYGNAVSLTQKATTLSQFNLRNEKNRGLVDDQVDVIDRAIAAQFQAAEFKAVMTATQAPVFTTNGTASATATNNLDDKGVRKIVSFMKKKLIPQVGKHYISLCSVESHQGVYDHLQSIAQYADPKFRFSDETGRYYGVRFIEDNSVLSNTIGHGSALGEAIFFGAEAVAEAVALPEELRYEEKDIGRSKILAWYSILGFAKIWSLSADDANSTGIGIERIVHVTSA